MVLSLALGKSSLHHIQGEGLPADLNSTSRRLWVANVVEFDSGTKGVCFNRCEDRECIICCTCSVDLGNRVTSDMLAHSLKMFLWGIRTKTSMQTRALLSLSLSLSLSSRFQNFQSQLSIVSLQSCIDSSQQSLPIRPSRSLLSRRHPGRQIPLSLLCRRPLHSLALAPPRSRISLISRHLEQRPLLDINTPFSTERQAGKQDDLEYTPIRRDPPLSAPPEDQKVNMSNQAEHPALLIPGPIEFDDAVLQSMGHFRCAGYPAPAIALY